MNRMLLSWLKLKGYGVIAVMLMVHSQTIGFSAQLEDTAIQVEPFTVYEVDVTNIDARTPAEVKVFYRIRPSDAIIPTVSFSAPGKTDQRTNVSGTFFFTFNQNALNDGVNTVRLTLNPKFKVDVAATRTEIRGPLVSEGVIATVLEDPPLYFRNIIITHELFEVYKRIEYSAPLIPGSKTIFVGNSAANISVPDTAESDDIGVWNETHLYRDNDGDHLSQAMTDVTGPTLPPQSGQFKSKETSNIAFFLSGNGLMGIAKLDYINFMGTAGVIVPLSLVNEEIDKPLE